MHDAAVLSYADCGRVEKMFGIVESISSQLQALSTSLVELRARVRAKSTSELFPCERALLAHASVECRLHNYDGSTGTLESFEALSLREVVHALADRRLAVHPREARQPWNAAPFWAGGREKLWACLAARPPCEVLHVVMIATRPSAEALTDDCWACACRDDAFEACVEELRRESGARERKESGLNARSFPRLDAGGSGGEAGVGPLRICPSLTGGAPST